MIIERKAGRTDSGLCCPDCGHATLWQPEDFSPCYDPWWCRGCRRFWRHGEYDQCGYLPLQRLVDNGTMARPVCGGPLRRVA
ncbi:hypothetical protein [Amycolatopsis sp. WQ 127309]|uniref:hypothetical protein n=1 Tax=Amycolatopsis sp. WQ 127309 TaxID=2932773 RepID=UPI001FF2CC0C|nr:hypothetical protein [Amycolatopsis sp. WQ 127309]UOZ10527.1 hypothetical protein MUY22_20590 [Amycolatopsis sp. WQ 127309]